MGNALVIGASGGIGAASAKLLAEKGHKVGAHYYKNKDAAETLAEGIKHDGGFAYPLFGELSSDEGARRLVSLMAYHVGTPDALIYSSGISTRKPFLELSDGDFRDILEVNFMGAVRTVRACLPYMIEGGGGSITLVSSMWGDVGASCESHYAASKGALTALAKSLAKELGVYNIRVNAVSPGLIDTPMNDGLSPADIASIVDRTPLSRVGEPTDVARAVSFLAFEADFVTGQNLGVSGGFVI